MGPVNRRKRAVRLTQCTSLLGETFALAQTSNGQAEPTSEVKKKTKYPGKKAEITVAVMDWELEVEKRTIAELNLIARFYDSRGFAVKANKLRQIADQMAVGSEEKNAVVALQETDQRLTA